MSVTRILSIAIIALLVTSWARADVKHTFTLD